MDGKDQSDGAGNRRRKLQTPQDHKEQRDYRDMQQDVRHMPAERREPKAPEIKNHPDYIGGSPVIAGGLVASLEGPHVGGQGAPKLRAILDQSVAHDLALVVIDEFSTERVCVDQKAKDQGRE